MQRDCRRTGVLSWHQPDFPCGRGCICERPGRAGRGIQDPWRKKWIAGFRHIRQRLEQIGQQFHASGSSGVCSACSHHLCPIMGKVWVAILVNVSPVLIASWQDQARANKGNTAPLTAVLPGNSNCRMTSAAASGES
ncbi:MAG: GTP cyclohydrolase I, partial [Proteobacteria bacterium]|nr:GTP cyclohydrolase I [Pseudomonadota bacterium]